MYPLTDEKRAKLTLISGGAASGKSSFAEKEALNSAGDRVYIATMQVWDDEGKARVEKHREQRRGKGFVTVECPVNLKEADIPRDSTVLLECMSNLAANECFSQKGFDCAEERILEGVNKLLSTADDLIIVTNELFSDGIKYESETMEYLKILSNINFALAKAADRVVEVVCGYPVYWKGEEN